LSSKIKITFVTMLIGTIAISGLPPFSGFFSKDEILAHAYEHSPILWFFGQLTSMLTVFYMFRLLFLTFYGKFRGTHEQEHHLHESPASMTFPLIVLAILSVVGGLLGLPEFWHMPNWMSNNLDTVILRKNPSTMPHDTEWMLMGIAVLAAIATIYFAYIVYMQKRTLPLKENDKMPGFQKLVYNKYYIDEIYNAVITKPLDVLSVAFHKFFDIQIIDGIVNGVGSAVKGIGSGVRLLQTGNIGFYVISMVIGIVFIVLVTFLI
ncbi:MAG: proton-conducting transporter membrane subunit, partial [Bacteroidota bacterium]|nr:proton-conducting transporter membrane subunit [Bacteroidota bacterium]